jgi:hypothetical protein
VEHRRSFVFPTKSNIANYLPRGVGNLVAQHAGYVVDLGVAYALTAA